MIFWLIAGGLTALAVVLLLLPLRRRAKAGTPRAAYDLNVYRDQLAEVERDTERGILGAEQAAAARGEVERRLLSAASRAEEGGNEAPASTAPPGPSRAVTLGIILFLPAAAFGLYLFLGAPGVPSVPLAERGPVPQGTATPGAMNELAERLAERLAAQPEDRDGWLLLGRTYTELGSYAEAAQAYRQAISQGFDDAETQSALGEALVAAAGGTVGPGARQAFAAALEKDPLSPRARYYGGLALAQDERLEDAIGIWMQLLAQSPPDAPWRPVVAQQIERAAASLGTPTPELPAGSGEPSAGAPEAVQQMSPQEQEAFIRSMVERLAARLEAEPGDFEGWLRLARSYGVLGEAERAQEALARAAGLIEQLPEDAPERTALDDAKAALAPAE